MTKLDFAIEEETQVLPQFLNTDGSTTEVVPENLENLDYQEEVVALDCYCQGIESALESAQHLLSIHQSLESYKDVPLTPEAKKIAYIAIESCSRHLNVFQTNAVSLESIQEETLSLEGIGSMLVSIWNAIVNTIKAIWMRVVNLFNWSSANQVKVKIELKTNTDKIQDILKNPSNWLVDDQPSETLFEHPLTLQLSKRFITQVGTDESIQCYQLRNKFVEFIHLSEKIGKMMKRFSAGFAVYDIFAKLNLKTVLEEKETNSYASELLGSFEDYYDALVRITKPNRAFEKHFTEKDLKVVKAGFNESFTGGKVFGYCQYEDKRFDDFNLIHAQVFTRTDLNEVTKPVVLTDVTIKQLSAYQDALNRTRSDLQALIMVYHESLTKYNKANDLAIRSVQKVMNEIPKNDSSKHRDLRLIFASMSNINTHVHALLSLLKVSQETFNDHTSVITETLTRFKMK